MSHLCYRKSARWGSFRVQGGRLLHVKCLMGLIVKYTYIHLVPKPRLSLSSGSDSLLWEFCMGRLKYDSFSGTREPYSSSSNELQESGKGLSSIPASRRCSPGLAVWSRALLAWVVVIKYIN